MHDGLERALQLAVRNVKEGGHPFGAVLMKNGAVVAEGVNTLHKKSDVTGHAEIAVLRKLQEEWGTTDLSDCVMYASGEPCPMCMTAMYFSGIQTVYYAQSVEDAAEVGLGLSGDVYKELSKDKQDRKIEMIHQPVESQALNAMAQYQNRS
ncbi:nucleoside deaminase [Halobacillus litoralis]|uniref:nucleoside deaminase n=1 Tax=Halobacillus litoralis TaxID=45668 RepID=UPI001CD47B73|nr:nucleoside deaminase [Halobacillus litoralis]MCA0971934.1 nucleoside deaminase [Halobacillus litoralis]